MTEEQRIEAAAKVMCIYDWDQMMEDGGPETGWTGPMDGKAYWRARASAILAIAYPEFHPAAGQEPTHWLAPMHPSSKNMPLADEWQKEWLRLRRVVRTNAQAE